MSDSINHHVESATAGILTSIVRTVVPLVVGLLVSLFAAANMTLDEGTVNAVAELIGVVVATAYYAIVRWLETSFSPAWGWLLGKAGGPRYPDAVETSGVERIQ